MYKIGIDVGSTFTKYCVMKDNEIVDLFFEKTPIKQKEYFQEKIAKLKKQYYKPVIKSCVYGKNNIDSVVFLNELTALARGTYYLFGNQNIVLDIGGQDTKIISQNNGLLKDFFLNDRCAAGSGMFLQNTCSLLNINFDDIDLSKEDEPTIKVSSTCAVFAQSEITQLLANNVDEMDIIKAVIWQTLTKAKALYDKIKTNSVILSGGFARIKGINRYCEKVFGCHCYIDEKSPYLSAIGCCLL